MKFIIGLLVGLALPAVAGYLYVVNVGLPVPVKSPTLPFEEWVAKKSLDHFWKGSDKLQPIVPADEKNLLEGAKVYMNYCAVCHGTMGGKPSEIAKGLFPPPPQLLDKDSGEVGYPPGSVFWTVKHGIRLTGMPGFSEGLTDTEVWQVAQMLIGADRLPPAVNAALTKKK